MQVGKQNNPTRQFDQRNAVTFDPQKRVAGKVYGNIKKKALLDIIFRFAMFTTKKNRIKSSRNSVKEQDIRFKFSTTVDPAKILRNPLKRGDIFAYGWFSRSGSHMVRAKKPSRCRLMERNGTGRFIPILLI